MRRSRSDRAAEGHRRALGASSGGKECAIAYNNFVQKREAFLEQTKTHGLKRGITEYDQCLQSLRVHCARLSTKFRLDECGGEDYSRGSSGKQQGNMEQASQSTAAAPSTQAAAGAAPQQQQQAVASVPTAPPPPPPLPGAPLLAKPAAGKATATAAKTPHVFQAQPPPPSGPAPPPQHVAAAKQHHGTQYNSSSRAAAGTALGARPPPPPPPPPPAFGKAKGAAAAVEGGVRPPPPRPGFLPSAAALRGTAAKGAEAAAGSSSSTAGPKGGVQTAPPPPPLPKQLGSSAAGSDGMNGLAAVAAAAAAANNGIAGSDSPAGEHEVLPPLNSSSSIAVAGGKLKTLHVDPVPVHRLAEGSFWKVADPVAKPFKDSMEYLLRTMFSDVPRSTHKHHHQPSPRTAHPGTPGGPSIATDGSAEAVECDVVTCVPEKRALHVEVVLKRLHMPAAALAAAINLLNTEKLKPDDLTSIRSILPKPEELQAVREAKHTAEKKAAALSPRTPTAAATPSVPAGSSTARSDGSATPSALSPRLGVVEAAFDALGGVELLQAKMRAMEFRYDVENVASVVFEYARDIGHSLDVLRVSGQLQYLLAFVRDVANTMNRTGPKGPLAGFKLESLARLQSTKMAGATDLNLLHYIVAHISAVLPGVLVLDAEREAFRSACRRGTFDSVTARIRTLLDTQKRLNADLAAAKKMQQQQQQQQRTQPDSAIQQSADSSSTAAAAAAAVVAGNIPCDGSSYSSSDSHDIYVARLTELLDNAGPTIDELQQQLDDVVTKFKWTAEYYCEDVKGQAWKQQPVAFLTHFLELLDSLAATQQDTARLARVTSMLAEYVAAQQMWHQRQVLLEQQEPEELAEFGSEDPQHQEQDYHMLLQQQQLLRQHLETSERLHERSGSSSSLGSASDLQAAEDKQLNDKEQQLCDGGSAVPSVNSSAEHTQLYDAEDASQQQQPQQKPACVPRLDLAGSGQANAAAPAACFAVCAEHSWGSVDSAEHKGNSGVAAANPTAEPQTEQPTHETQQQVPGLLSRGSPVQQPADAGSTAARIVVYSQGVQQQQDLVPGVQHSIETALVTASWSPSHSVGAFGLDEDANSSKSISMPDAAGQLAAEAAAVARCRAGATNLSRSLDSGMFAAVHGWQDEEGTSAAASSTRLGKHDPAIVSSAAKPPSGSSTPGSYSKAHLLQLHQQQKLGLRQPWRPAGQKGSSQQQQRGKAILGSPVKLHKRPQQEAQLAREAEAAAVQQQCRPKSVSPTPGKLTVQQQRLEALRLRGKRGTPEQQKQQDQHANEEAGGLACSIKECEDPREKLARLLQSSIDSQV